MWCPACRADVAAELSLDNRRYCCARCQTELGLAAGAIERTAPSFRLPETERSARELLARWSTQNVLETPLTSSVSSASLLGTTSTDQLDADRIPAPIRPLDARSKETVETTSSAKQGLRYDGAHPTMPAPKQVASGDQMTAEQSSFEDRGDDNRRSKERRKVRRKTRRPRIAVVSQDDKETGHDSVSGRTAEAPISTTTTRHEELVRSAVEKSGKPKTNWMILIGQICAYGGVGLLTCGTALVLSGYFGGPVQYAPTGWLVAAVGQMLLFLGVVTLISGGMEQTVDEVAWRIDYLAERIVFLERMLSERETRERIARRKQRQQRPDDRADAA